MIAAAIGLPYLLNRIDEEIRIRAEALFANHYPHLKVSIRSAELVEGVGIEIRGMSFSERAANTTGVADARGDGPSGPFVYLEHVILNCPTELTELLCPNVPISKITIHRPTFRVSRRADGSWNMAKLLPLPRCGNRQPEIVIEGGVVEISDERKNPPSMYTLRDVNLRLGTPQRPPAEGPVGDGSVEHFSSSLAKRQPTASSSKRVLSGSLTGDHLRRVEFTGEFIAAAGPSTVGPSTADRSTVNRSTSSWDIGGVVEGLELSPELCVSLPSLATGRLRKVLGTFRGRGRFGFRLQSGDSPNAPLLFQLCGDVDEGRLDDRRLPYPLMNMSATICCNNDGFSVKNLFAQSGQTTLRLSGKMAGFDEKSSWELEAEIDNLKLEQSLAACLPAKLQGLWAKYNPSGELGRMKVKLQSDASGFRPDLAEISAQCGDVAFCYAKFPYALEHAQGDIDLKGGVLTATLTAFSAGQPVEIKAEVFNPISTLHNKNKNQNKSPLPPAGWTEIRAACIPLDNKLFTAIEKFNIRARTTLGLLDPRGSVGFYGKIWRDEPGATPQRHFIIGLNGCSIKFEKFPYPIRDIRGTIERHTDGSWSLHDDIEGYNDAGKITCKGSLSNTPSGRLLSLTLTGTDIPLEKELRDAMPPNMQRVWDDTKPRGIIHLDEIKIDWLADEKKLNLTVVGRPRGDTVSIEPKAFPYRMENIEGRMIYRDGHVTMERFKARHGQIEMSASGYCQFPKNGGMHFHLDDVNVDRLRLDRELVVALPSRLRKGLMELNPAGPMYLRNGSLDLVSSGLPGDPIRAGWYMALGFHQCSIDCGIKLHNMHGGLTVAGQFDGEHYFSQGELDIDSLMYKDIQFTKVIGPLLIDNDNIWLGYAKQAGEQGAANPLSRVLTAKVFGGTVKGDCHVRLDGGPHYSIQAQLSGADLAQCAKETMPGRQQLQGKVSANVALRGSGKSRNTLQGRGEIKLREANVYELPLMVSMLKIISGSEPDTNAFSESDIRFSIGGNHIYFNPINFTGDAISLRGSGEMDFQSKVNLKFYTVVGRDKLHIPILSPIMGGASQQAMVINVTGPLHNPRITRDIFPSAKKALQQLQADLRGTAGLGSPAGGNQAPARFPGQRPWAPPSGQPYQRQQPLQPPAIKP